jgi:hypothetical protein
LLEVGRWAAISTVLPVVLKATESPPESLVALGLLVLQWYSLSYFNKRLRGLRADLPGPASVGPEDPHDQKVLLDLIAFALVISYCFAAWYYVIHSIFFRNEA